jgi:hypothetical protein
MSKKEEVSIAGAVAGYNAPLSGAPIKKNMSKPFDKKVKKKRKKMKKNKRKVPYDIIDEQSHNVIRDTIFKIILEGKEEDKIGYIMSLFDGINRQIGVSMGYSKTFIVDGLKAGELDKAKKLSFRRSKTELKHVKRLIDDLDMLINHIYELSGDEKTSAQEEIGPAAAAAITGLGSAVGGIAKGVGSAVGGVASGVGSAIGGIAQGVGDAVSSTQ